MKEFTYVIKDEIGIHARPAGNLVKLLKDKKSAVTIECKGKRADAKKIFSFNVSEECIKELKLVSKIYLNEKIEKEYKI